MGKIENVKTYSGKDLDTIFFRPMLTGKSAEELGIKIMYNTSVPAKLHFWKRSGDILQQYSASGWKGGAPATKYQKDVAMHKVKAEIGYSADDYFSFVYELITNSPEVNMDDLSGTELEAAETQLFRESIAESIRATMWLGDTSGWEEKLLKTLWENASEQLKELKSEGQLAYFVTSDIYNAYEDSLDNVLLDAAYMAKQAGRDSLLYRGIPVIDVQVSGYLDKCPDMPSSFAFLTDRRNLALFVNTNEVPGTEVRMWYNPDLMENRQRAIFMAGCDYLLPELLTFATEQE